MTTRTSRPSAALPRARRPRRAAWTLPFLVGLIVAACDPADEPGLERWPAEDVDALIAHGAADQDDRAGLDSPEALQDTALMGRMARGDTARSRWLRARIERYGWPDPQVVGDSAVNAAFLIVQHTPFDDWQVEMLPHVRRALDAGAVSGQSYALLYDRVQRRAGRPQRFGTQLSRDGDTLVLGALEDADSVDAWRADVGLGPLSQYLEVVGEAYGMPVSPGEYQPPAP